MVHKKKRLLCRVFLVFFACIFLECLLAFLVLSSNFHFLQLQQSIVLHAGFTRPELKAVVREVGTEASFKCQ